MHPRIRALALRAGLTATCLLWNAAQAEPARLVGASLPLTGGAAAYGQGLAQGLKLGLAKAPPGPDGRAIELRVLDDGGDPARATGNARQLIDAGAIALTGLYGSRSVEAVRSLLASSGVPLIGAATSTESLRTSPQREIFNLRAGAGDEVAAIVLHLDTIGVTRYGVLSIDDGLGTSGADWLAIELARIGMRTTANEHVAASSTDAALLATLKRVCSSDPETVLLALDTRRALRVLSSASAAGCSGAVRFVALSETATGLDGASIDAGIVTPSGLVVSQVLPHPTRLEHPLVSAYRRDLGKSAKPSYASLEGYLYGRTLAELLRQCANRLSSRCLIEALESRGTDIAGWHLRFSREERRGSRYVDLTWIGPDGKLRR